MTSMLGFSLVELLVSMMVVAILLGFAAPSFRTMLMDNRLLTEVDSLITDLNYARNTALNRNVTITVCPISTPNTPVCGSEWRQGWMVIDRNTHTILQSHSLATNAPTLSSVAIAGASTNLVEFNPRGLATTQTNFKFCDKRGAEYARSVEVAATGFIQAGTLPGVAVWNGGTLICP